MKGWNQWVIGVPVSALLKHRYSSSALFSHRCWMGSVWKHHLCWWSWRNRLLTPKQYCHLIYSSFFSFFTCYVRGITCKKFSVIITSNAVKSTQSESWTHVGGPAGLSHSLAWPPPTVSGSASSCSKCRGGLWRQYHIPIA